MDNASLLLSDKEPILSPLVAVKTLNLFDTPLFGVSTAGILWPAGAVDSEGNIAHPSLENTRRLPSLANLRVCLRSSQAAHDIATLLRARTEKERPDLTISIEIDTTSGWSYSLADMEELGMGTDLRARHAWCCVIPRKCTDEEETRFVAYLGRRFSKGSWRGFRVWRTPGIPRP